MIRSYGSQQKITAKQKAAELVDDMLDDLLNSWSDRTLALSKEMTEAEARAVNEQIERYVFRIQKMLGGAK